MIERAFGKSISFPNPLSVVVLCTSCEFGKINYVLFGFPSASIPDSNFRKINYVWFVSRSVSLSAPASASAPFLSYPQQKYDMFPHIPYISVAEDVRICFRTHFVACCIFSARFASDLWSTNDNESADHNDAADDNDAMADNDAIENNLQQTTAAGDHSETAGANEAIDASSARQIPDDNCVFVGVSAVVVAETPSSDAPSLSPVSLANLIYRNSFRLERFPLVMTKPAPTST